MRSVGSGAMGNSRRSPVVIGIAGLRAITREIDLPFVPDDEIDSAVQVPVRRGNPVPSGQDDSLRAGPR